MAADKTHAAAAASTCGLFLAERAEAFQDAARAAGLSLHLCVWPVGDRTRLPQSSDVLGAAAAPPPSAGAEVYSRLTSL